MYRITLSRTLALPIFLFAFIASCFSQSNGQILVISNVESKVVVDGTEVGIVKANVPGKYSITIGEHYLQVITLEGQEKNEILTIEEDKQKVLKFEFGDAIDSSEKILVADLDLNIPGLVTANADENFEYPYQLFAFEKGDEVAISIEMHNAKGTNRIEVFSYPDLNIIYSNDSFQDLKDLKISIKERSIYGISYGSNHAFDRDAQLRIDRTPASEEARDFNTTVTWKETYTVQKIHKPQRFRLNSVGNEIVGGKASIVLPVNLPQNTIKWFYIFSASRSQEEIEGFQNTMNLAGELTRSVDQTGLLSLGVDLLTQPPGSAHGQVYLLDQENVALFESNQSFYPIQEGSRDNYESGVVEIACCVNDQYFLGFYNRSDLYGMSIAVEVAAIVKEESWVMGE